MGHALPCTLVTRRIEEAGSFPRILDENMFPTAPSARLLGSFFWDGRVCGTVAGKQAAQSVRASD
jgi:hypothetical protein